MVSISMAIVDTQSIEVNTLQLMYREPQIAHFWNLFVWKASIIIEKS